MVKSCYIFDLDGTMCDVSHRQHFVASKPKNWKAWQAGLPNDEPNKPVVDIYLALKKLENDNLKVLLVSGRNEHEREATLEWFSKHNLPISKLFMRADKDFRHDDIIKSEIAHNIMRNYTILGVFDDRKRVVDMWQSLGIFTFDVGQGRGDF